ncbi:hypothetical protein EVAR_62815_1 [Eumeta japonica]|uniref:Uncharacterized protein n=1 Tax=Eumeta variegata TaxID=151549 RepID=A0A4C2AAY8_EUMVA|nr:hypothetical protein EVAR_62815_1 [Eumeta japonica]
MAELSDDDGLGGIEPLAPYFRRAARARRPAERVPNSSPPRTSRAPRPKKANVTAPEGGRTDRVTPRGVCAPAVSSAWRDKRTQSRIRQLLWHHHYATPHASARTLGFFNSENVSIPSHSPHSRD